MNYAYLLFDRSLSSVTKNDPAAILQAPAFAYIVDDKATTEMAVPLLEAFIDAFREVGKDSDC